MLIVFVVFEIMVVVQADKMMIRSTEETTTRKKQNVTKRINSSSKTTIIINKNLILTPNPKRKNHFNRNFKMKLFSHLTILLAKILSNQTEIPYKAGDAEAKKVRIMTEVITNEEM